MKSLTNITALITTGAALPANWLRWIEGVQVFNPLLTLALTGLSIISISIVIHNGLRRAKLDKIDFEIKKMQLSDEINKHKNV